MNKDQMIQEIQVLERIEGYFKNYPIESVLRFVRKDLSNVQKRLKDERKRESNRKYRQGC